MGLVEMAVELTEVDNLLFQVEFAGTGEPEGPIGTVFGVVSERAVLEAVEGEEFGGVQAQGPDGVFGGGHEGFVAGFTVGDGFDAEVYARGGFGETAFHEKLVIDFPLFVTEGGELQHEVFVLESAAKSVPEEFWEGGREFAPILAFGDPGEVGGDGRLIKVTAAEGGQAAAVLHGGPDGVGEPEAVIDLFSG